MKTKTAKAFTMAEILVVIAIIAVMLGLLMPALSQIKKLAKETKQKAQITSIEMGIELYKNDFGEYPPSHGTLPVLYQYSGAQMLTEAMLGLDLLGFHPDSIYDPDADQVLGDAYYDPNKTNLPKRKGPYLQRENIDVFTPADIFGLPLPFPNGLVSNRYAICDVFTEASRTVGGKKCRVGTPVLYFKANTAKMEIDVNDPNGSIYNFYDNQFLIDQGRIIDGKNHDGFVKAPGTNKCGPFYVYIRDPLASTPSLSRPVRPDTYLLISAGYDGLYGTGDDICNFKPNIE